VLVLGFCKVSVEEGDVVYDDRGELKGKKSLCFIHLLYVILFGSDHWHRYVSYVLEILYISLAFLVLWDVMEVMGNSNGL